MKLITYSRQLLDYFSMYSGILLGLAAIWGLALVLAFLKVLSFSPAALLASTIIFIGSTYAASYVCGRLFGVKIHTESSLITGLILSLIFTPVLIPAQLLVYGFIGGIAAASKFLLVWRGRHIFNPVAIAAVIATIMGVGFATWWVATPPLFIMVLLVVAVLLYQTRRFMVAGIFVATSTLLVMGTLIFQGLSLAAALALLPSWPIVFFAGIMLTEPLTLPPRKHHMYVEAAIVGVLFGLPIHLVGNITMNPALALVIGNIIAAFLASRQAIMLVLKAKKHLTPTSQEFIFEPAKPYRYLPGQYMELTLPHVPSDLRGSRRAFSITSAPQDSLVRFGVKFYTPSSSFKKKLQLLKKGDRVSATHIAGDFVLPKDTTVPLVFVAGGIGITPFVSQLRSLQATKEKRDIVLLYAMSNAKELAYREVLEASDIEVIVVCPESLRLPKHWRHIQATRIDAAVTGSLAARIKGRIGYVSGPPLFVQSARRLLKRNGSGRVHTDYFAGY